VEKLKEEIKFMNAFVILLMGSNRGLTPR